MKIAILGYAGQGRSAYEYWSGPENQITICDADPNVELPGKVDRRLGQDYLKGLDEFDVLVRTPALHPRGIVAANPAHPGILEKVTTVTNEFFRVCPTKNIIGVTGTKGKGTTSTLITKMLEAAGHRVHLGGNIGIPPLNMLKNGIEPKDWVVLELANFQLIDLKYSPPLAVCLMVNPEHLDWHTDFAEYIRTKQQLFIHQKASDTAIYYSQNQNSKDVASTSPGNLIPYMMHPGATVEGGYIVIGGETICSVNELKMLGKHNWQNACAAATAAWQVAQDTAPLRSALTSFAGLPHRLELVRTISEVRFYNDSFASAPSATEAAIDAINGMKILIVGGFDRMLDLQQLAAYIKSKSSELRKLVLIGASAARFAEALKAAGYENFELIGRKTMNGIVELAYGQAQKGDAVILSPGFPSFDMFKNFEDRGLQFKHAVKSL